MVTKMTNKEEKFYQYMGKYFGSRLVERQTNDRIYDDDNKVWYIYFEDDKAMAFVSVNKNVIKNIYTLRETYLEEILNVVKKEEKIVNSIVTNCYVDVYKKCGYKINENQNHKNFVTIYVEK